jgi:hypothetical protein
MDVDIAGEKIPSVKSSAANNQKRSDSEKAALRRSKYEMIPKESLSECISVSCGYSWLSIERRTEVKSIGASAAGDMRGPAELTASHRSD